MMVDYDLIIIGAGPAGMNACLYASRAGLKTLVIEKDCPGGKVVKANNIENWLGAKQTNGADLALAMFNHSFSFGGVYEQGNVLDVVDKGKYKEVVLKDRRYKCYSVIIAVGTSESKVGVEGEDKFYGRGVSYCVVCDAPLYKNKIVAVVGDSNYAFEEAIYISKFASKVYLICSDVTKISSGNLLEEVRSKENIELKKGYRLDSIEGTNCVKNIVVSGTEKEVIDVSAVFPLIGQSVDSRFSSRLGIVDDKNYILVNERKETKIEGVYAAGDCTNTPLRQIITAGSDGAIAALEALKYINKIKKEITYK